ncbi:MAG: membrane protein insertion efficiency factor YidD [Nitrospiraceae bacterium]|nr:membrane protein insertion efficiency factor YidD [Nitrospiraceae bacterium]
MKKLVLLLIGFYQAALSPFLPSSCRFTPSCSEYAKQAVVRYGALKGGWLGIKRLLRCHPFNAGGYDPLR